MLLRTGWLQSRMGWPPSWESCPQLRLRAEQPGQPEDRAHEGSGNVEALSDLGDGAELRGKLQRPPGLEVGEHRCPEIAETLGHGDPLGRSDVHLQVQMPRAHLHLFHHAYA